jgi:hypothetical protein
VLACAICLGPFADFVRVAQLAVARHVGAHYPVSACGGLGWQAAGNAIVSIGRPTVTKRFLEVISITNALDRDLTGRPLQPIIIVAPKRFEQNQTKRDRFGKDPVVLRG